MHFYNKRRLLAVAMLLASAGICFAQKKTKEENVIAQMNYCISTLTNIVNNKSMAVLDHESDQLLNNLTMEQAAGLYEISNFRVDLLDAIGRFQITEEERALMRRIQSIKRDNMKWEAIGSALNPTALLTGGGGLGYQAAFQALLMTARTVVDYQAMQGEQDIEELRAMWDLRKEDLSNINDVRTKAMEIVFSLYDKYNLREFDRLTEETSLLFYEITTEANAAKRMRLLEDNRSIYAHYAPYYYHLGMAYVDLGQFPKAKTCFETYVNLYSRTPLLRYDEKSGIIALTMMAYAKDQTPAQKEKLISIALANLPNNSAAALQCAMVYISELNQVEKGLDVLRSALDNKRASDPELLMLAAVNLLPMMKDYPDIEQAVLTELESSLHMDIDTYIYYRALTEKNAWYSVEEALSMNRAGKYSWTWIKKQSFNNKVRFVLPRRLIYTPGDFRIYREEHSNGKIAIEELGIDYSNAITDDDINDVGCFKANENMKYLFVEKLPAEGYYILKDNIDLKQVQREEWPRMSEFTLSSRDVKSIVKFCKKQQKKAIFTELKCHSIKGETVPEDAVGGLTVTFKGDSLVYMPQHYPTQEGTFLRIITRNGVELLYKYQPKHSKSLLIPMYYTICGQMVFESVDAEIEYKAKPILEEPKVSWWSRMRDNKLTKEEKAELKRQKAEQKALEKAEKKAIKEARKAEKLARKEAEKVAKERARAEKKARKEAEKARKAEEKAMKAAQKERAKAEAARQKESDSEAERPGFFKRLWSSTAEKAKNVKLINKETADRTVESAKENVSGATEWVKEQWNGIFNKEDDAAPSAESATQE